MKKALLLLTVFIAGNIFAQRSKVTPAGVLSKNSIIQQVAAITGTPRQKKTLKPTDASYDTTARNLYEYDAKKRVVSDIGQDKVSGTYRNKSKELTYYISTNATAYPDSGTTYEWKNNSWVESLKGTFTYKDQSKGLYKRIFLDGLGTFSLISNYYYDNNNFVTSIKDSVSSPFFNFIDSIAFQNNASGSPLTEDIFIWDDITKTYSKDTHTIYSYDANNILLVNTLQRFDTTAKKFVDFSRTNYTYNSSNNVTLSIEQKWSQDSTLWVDSVRTTTVYKNVTEYDYQLVDVWNGFFWGKKNKYVWSNEGALGIKSIKQYADVFNLYPNPVTDRATIVFNLTTAQAVRINVIDVTGKQVLKLVDNQLNAGLHTVNTNLSELKKGLYFVNLTIGNVQSTQKLIIQ